VNRASPLAGQPGTRPCPLGCGAVLQRVGSGTPEDGVAAHLRVVHGRA